jgi:hypothetical protein
MQPTPQFFFFHNRQMMETIVSVHGAYSKITKWRIEGLKVKKNFCIPVPKSLIHTGLDCAKNLTTEILWSRPFKGIVPRDKYFFEGL